MFDPTDHAGAPREAPYQPGHDKPMCTDCGGVGYGDTEHGVQWCFRCGGSGDEPPTRGCLAPVLAVLFGLMLAGLFITAWRALF